MSVYVTILYTLITKSNQATNSTTAPTIAFFICLS